MLFNTKLSIGLCAFALILTMNQAEAYNKGSGVLRSKIKTAETNNGSSTALDNVKERAQEAANDPNKKRGTYRTNQIIKNMNQKYNASH